MRALDNNEDDFKYFSQIFQHSSEAKIKKGNIHLRFQIGALLFHHIFEIKLNKKELAAWKSFKDKSCSKVFMANKKSWKQWPIKRTIVIKL